MEFLEDRCYVISTYMTVCHTRLTFPNPSYRFYKRYSIQKVKKATYPSLSNAAAGVHGRIWSLNLPRCWAYGLNCVFRYCLISFGDAQCGIVPSLYWSRAAAMWALSSFSELQITTRDSPTREWNKDTKLQTALGKNQPKQNKTSVRMTSNIPNLENSLCFTFTS